MFVMIAFIGSPACLEGVGRELRPKTVLFWFAKPMFVDHTV